MTAIRPTHTCFDDAMELLSERTQEAPALAADGGLLLVHAICLAPEGPHAGQRFAHAWVEERRPDGAWAAWQAGYLDGHRITYACERDDLVEGLRVQAATRYTAAEVVQANHRTGTYGPWEECYLALCSSDGKVFGDG